VMLDDTSITANSLQIDPFGLQPGEADQVGRAIAAALAVPGEAVASAPPPAIDVSGIWDVGVSFLQGERAHRLHLQQQDGAITGSQTSQQFEGPVTGRLDAAGVHLVFRTRYEGTDILYRLDGSVADGRMQGQVTLGGSTDHHQGPINAAQFGSGRFQGERTGRA
jgi:D-glucosaminate-6-phosphate ammonia-lyase